MNLDTIKDRLGSHGSRWVAGIALLLVTIFPILSEQYIFFYILMLTLGGLCWWEYSINLFGSERTGLMALALAGWLIVASGAYFFGPSGQSLGLVAALALGAGYSMWALEKESGPVLLNLLGRYTLGHLYLSFLMSFFLLLKKTDAGKQWLIYAIVVTIAADIAAYYVGSRLKGPKLCPKISPNKTVSGLLGGAVASMLISIVSVAYLPAEASKLIMCLAGLFLGFWGAMGDLFESTIKRALDIKDTSTLLLGHGGFLDRFDSLLFNIVPVYVLADFLVPEKVAVIFG